MMHGHKNIKLWIDGGQSLVNYCAWSLNVC